ncbi:MAG TPA: FmdB family zinc ribbon protein [Longimicrobiales bacterium]
MPTYEYRCPEGHEFELFQRISDDPVAACPRCGKRAERLLSTGAGLLFKGSGFYITDYRSESYKKAAEADKSDGASSSDKAKAGASSGKSDGAAASAAAD